MKTRQKRDESPGYCLSVRASRLERRIVIMSMGGL